MMGIPEQNSGRVPGAAPRERRPLLRGRAREQPRMPAADAPTSVYVPGDDPARVLVLGDGPAVGFGLDSHAQAMSGRLARALSAATSRGTVVDIRSSATMTPIDALEIARGIDLSGYQAVVVTLGMFDVVRRTPSATWARAMAVLIDHLAWATGGRTALVIGSVPHAPLVRLPSGITGSATDSAADALTRALRALPLPDEAVVVTLDHGVAGDAPVLEDTATLYRRWATDVASAIDTVGLWHPQPVAIPAVSSVESRRVAALRRLNILDTATDDRFDGLVALAQRRFDAPIAALNFIDDRRVWVKCIRGFAAGSTDRGDALCDVTIRDDRTLVIPDATVDPRFAENPFVVGPPFVRFYAGHPIESPDGERIGSLCVLDSTPRNPSAGELATLRELAGRVQEALYAPKAG